MRGLHCRTRQRYTEWSDAPVAIMTNALWGARCGKSARRVLNGETSTRGHAGSVRSPLRKQRPRRGSAKATASSLVSTDQNVPTHRFEKRALADGEQETNTVLHFEPNPPEPMIVACLWSHWSGKDEPELDSFAAITDEPPPEIAETGHERCIISLQPNNVDEWLAPANVPKARLEAILSERKSVFYEHRKAA